jgi:hypothetical protein
MESSLLLEYLRTGTISPLAKADSKRQVESKLGKPDDWKGRVAGIGWEGPPFADFHDSWAWHYGSLCVCFPHPQLHGLPGIHLDYSELLKPVRFAPPFTDLPSSTFTISELIDLLRSHDIQFNDLRPDRFQGLVLVSEGGVAVSSRAGYCSSSAHVTYLFPHEFRSA